MSSCRSHRFAIAAFALAVGICIPIHYFVGLMPTIGHFALTAVGGLVYLKTSATNTRVLDHRARLAIALVACAAGSAVVFAFHVRRGDHLYLRKMRQLREVQHICESDARFAGIHCWGSPKWGEITGSVQTTQDLEKLRALVVRYDQVSGLPFDVRVRGDTSHASQQSPNK